MIKLFLLILIISINLNARINPFDVDPQFNIQDENKSGELKPIKIEETITSKDDGTRTVNIQVQNTKAKVEKIILKEIPKVKEKEKIIEKKLTKAEIDKLCEIKEKEKKAKMKKVFVPAKYKVLPFLTIDVKKNDIKLTSRKHYRIFRHYKLKKSNKIAIDYIANVSFYTRSKKLNSPSFKGYKVGNHKEDNFFRVTVELRKNLKNYEIIMKNHIAHIIYK